MKITIKILILVLSIALAIAGVMVYAKTRVEPPVEIQPINQFSKDLNKAYSELTKANSIGKEDYIYAQTIDRIAVFEREKRLTHAESDKHKDTLLAYYAPIFLKRCFSKFEQPVWNPEDHNRMLAVSRQLKSVRHNNISPVLQKSTLDSLALVDSIIEKYRRAKEIIGHTTYDGIDNAERIINQANAFANDPYLSKCTDLRQALNKVRINIGNAHYKYVEEQVERLSNYTYFGEDYYSGTLVKQVEDALDEYKNKADSLYGAKNDVNTPQTRMNIYKGQASSYYNKH